MINGEQHSWSSMSAALLGTVLTGILEINYDDKFDTKGVKAKGIFDVGFTQGNYEAKGDITLLISEVHAIQAAAKAAGFTYIQEIPLFSVSVSYQLSTGKIVTDTFLAKFTTNSRNGRAATIDALSTKMELYIPQIFWGSN
jgi:hypothetical protein